MKINGKSWNFIISQGFLGNLGTMKSTPQSYLRGYSPRLAQVGWRMRCHRREPIARIRTSPDPSLEAPQQIAMHLNVFEARLETHQKRRPPSGAGGSGLPIEQIV